MRRIAKILRTNFLIAIIALLTFVSTLAYLQSLDKKIYAAKLTKNIYQGKSISSKDIEFIKISKDENVAKNIISKSQFKKYKFIAKIDLTKSSLLSLSSLSKTSIKSGLQSLSIGIDIDRANGGYINHDDKIDIYKTGDESQLIASDISVRSIIKPNKRLGVSTSNKITIVLAVTQSQAEAISQVIGTQDLMIVISTGSKTKKLETKQINSYDFEPVNIQEDK